MSTLGRDSSSQHKDALAACARAQAERERVRAEGAVANAVADRRTSAAILGAIEVGASLRDVAPHMGLDHSRVWQLIREHRPSRET
jgi:hypothetical protein